MSVTTPIFRLAWVTEAAADGDAAADGEAPPADADAAAVDADADAGCEAVAVDALGLLPDVHAVAKMARTPSSVRPDERVRICPPRSSSAVRPGQRVAGSGSASKELAPRGDHRRIVTMSGSAGQAGSMPPAWSVAPVA